MLIKEADIKDSSGRKRRMTDYLWAKTENVQKWIDKLLKEQKEKLIEEFKNIRDRIMIAMKERYGKTAKGNEYLENLFKDELEKLEEWK